MLINSDKIKSICGSGNYTAMDTLKRFPVFSEIICSFLDALSSELLNDAECRQYPDVITFGFFCRKGNINALKIKYCDIENISLGRGVSFHIAPSNVPVNFAYSMIAALLAGNSCIVRASSKPFRQTDIICKHVDSVLSRTEFSCLSDYIQVVKYEHDKDITDYFSSICDIRIIWGGDSTISDIRKSPVGPRTIEITFADRYSLAVINAASILECEDMHKITADFYNDTYLFDQNACSSPRLIYWLGNAEDTRNASDKFWNAVHDFINEKNYKIEPVTAVDKYMTACRASIDLDADVHYYYDNRISCIRISDLSSRVPDYRCAGGSFIEYFDETLDALSNIVTNKVQTLSFLGIPKEALTDYILKNGVSGIDRVVPVGKTTEFSLTWDGTDLIRNMSRIIS